MENEAIVIENRILSQIEDINRQMAKLVEEKNNWQRMLAKIRRGNFNVSGEIRKNSINRVTI